MCVLQALENSAEYKAKKVNREKQDPERESSGFSNENRNEESYLHTQRVDKQ